MTGRVVVVGDVIDDIVVTLHGAVRPGTDAAAGIHLHPGGSAANVAAWLGTLGAPVDVHGRVGAADVARHRDALERLGVRTHLQADPDAETGRIVVLVEGDSRTFLTMRGAAGRLDMDAVDDAALAGAAVLHLTGHPLLDDGGLPAAAALIARARDAGVEVVLDPSSAGFITDVGARDFLTAVRGVDALLPNLDEGRALTGLNHPDTVAEALTDAARTVVLTLGAAGVVVAERGEPVRRVAAVPASVVDPTGAGDAFAAGFIAARCDGADAVTAARAGAVVAARAVGTRGGRP